jgi:outer membrane lipopolysaccharide assembly protein LptE/RlpB
LQINQLLIKSIFCALTVLLSACGFQLRQETVLLEAMSPMVWQSEVDADSFYQTFRDELADYRVQLHQDPADVLITLHSFDVKNTLLGKLRTLQVTAVWSLTNQWGDAIIYRRISHAQVSKADDDASQFLDELTVQLYQALSEKIIAQLGQVREEQLDTKPKEQ